MLFSYASKERMESLRKREQQLQEREQLLKQLDDKLRQRERDLDGVWVFLSGLGRRAKCIHLFMSKCW